MKKLCAFALLGTIAGAAQAQFTIGNLVVSRVGDGSAPLTSASTAVFIDQYTTGGAAVNSTAITGLTMGGTEFSEGYLNTVKWTGDPFNVNNYGVSFGGYDTGGVPVLGVASTSSSTTNRRAGVLRFDGTQSFLNFTNPSSGNPFNGGNIRSVSFNPQAGGGRYGLGGNGAGLYRADFTGASTTYSNSIQDSRVTQMSANIMYVSSGAAGSKGIFQVPNGGVSTGLSATAIVQFDPVFGSPWDFEITRNFSGDPASILVTDDSTGSFGGLWMASGWNGSAFGSPTQIMTAAAMSTSLGTSGLGIRQMAVVGTDVYATTVEASANKIVKLSFANGFANGLTGSSVVATAGANTAFRGIEVVPEPGSIAALGLGLLGLASRRRKK